MRVVTAFAAAVAASSANAFLNAPPVLDSGFTSALLTTSEAAQFSGRALKLSGASIVAHGEALAAEVQVEGQAANGVVLWDEIPSQALAFNASSVLRTAAEPTTAAFVAPAATKHQTSPPSTLLREPDQLQGVNESDVGVNASLLGPAIAISRDWIVQGRRGLTAWRSGGVVVWARRPDASTPPSALRDVVSTTDTDGPLPPVALLLPASPAQASNTTTSSTPPRRQLLLDGLLGLNSGGSSEQDAVAHTEDQQLQQATVHFGGNPYLPSHNSSTSGSDNSSTAGLPLAAPSLAFGAAVALDGRWLAVGAPGWNGASATQAGNPASAEGAAFLFALSRVESSPGTGWMKTQATLVLHATVPSPAAMAGAVGAASGPNTGLSTLTDASRQAARCGASVALGGGFLVVGCPGLAVGGAVASGAVVVYRRADWGHEGAMEQHSLFWPAPVDESLTRATPLRGERSTSLTAHPQYDDNAARSPWVEVQLLAPSQALSGEALGSCCGLAVTSRLLAVAGSDSGRVTVWRRRNGLARGFDPRLAQELHPVVLAGVPSSPPSLDLLGRTLVVAPRSRAAEPPGGARPVVALYRADASNTFHDRPTLLWAAGGDGNTAHTQEGQQEQQRVTEDNTTLGLPRTTSCDVVSTALALAAASHDSTATRSIRAAVVCGSPSGNASLAVVDAPISSCPALEDHAAEWTFPLRLFQLRQLYGGVNGTDPVGGCNAVVPRSLGSHSHRLTPPSDVSNTSRFVPPDALLSGGAGGTTSDAPPASCVAPCAYGAALTSGSQILTCEATGTWDRFPDELPLCERLFFTADAVVGLPAEPSAGQAWSAELAPAAVEDAAPAGGLVGSDALIARLRFAAIPDSSFQPTVIPAQDATSFAHPPMASLAGARNSRLPDVTRSLAALMGSTRGFDGSYEAARGTLPSSPLLVPAAGTSATVQASSWTGVGHNVTTAAALAGLLLTTNSRPQRQLAQVPGKPSLPDPEDALLAGADAYLLLTPREAGQGADAANAGASAAHTPAADPRYAWRDDAALTLDPLRSTRAVPVPNASQVASPSAQRAFVLTPQHVTSLARVYALSTTSTNSSNAGGASTLSPTPLAPAPGLPLIRFHPTGRTPGIAALQPAGNATLGPRSDVAGHLALTEGDLLTSEGLLGARDGGVDADVALVVRGNGALGGARLVTTMPLRLCCDTGLGEAPADEARRSAGPFSTRVVVSATDAYSYSDWMKPALGSSVPFLHAVLAQVSLRLGNMSAARRWAQEPDGSANETMHPDVPGVGVEIVRQPQYGYNFAPTNLPGETHRTVGGKVPNLQWGASLELRVTGFGFGDPLTGNERCFVAQAKDANVSLPHVAGPQRHERVATVRVQHYPNNVFSNEGAPSLEQAAEVARAILRAARQPLTWFRRRRCAAFDRRLLVDNGDTGIGWS